MGPNLEKVREMSSTVKRLEEISLSIASSNNKHIYFWSSGKTVFEEEGEIYKVSRAEDARMRLSMIKYFEENKIGILLPEVLVKDCSNKVFWTTRQQKILLDDEESNDEKLLQEIGEQYGKDFMDRFNETTKGLGFMWFAGNFNYGRDKDGKIKIFDWVANVATKIENSKVILIGKEGRALFSWENPSL